MISFGNWELEEPVMAGVKQTANITQCETPVTSLGAKKAVGISRVNKMNQWIGLLRIEVCSTVLPQYERD